MVLEYICIIHSTTKDTQVGNRYDFLLQNVFAKTEPRFSVRALVSIASNMCRVQIRSKSLKQSSQQSSERGNTFVHVHSERIMVNRRL